MGKSWTDLFEYDNHDYLLVLDYVGRFPIIRRLENNTAKCVVKHFKSILYKRGIVENITSSPGNPTGNGLAKKYVDVIKQRLR